MKIKLKKGTSLLAWTLKDGYITIQSTKDVIFDQEEFTTLIVGVRRKYYFKEPIPVYEGKNVISIEWSINNDTEEDV